MPKIKCYLEHNINDILNIPRYKRIIEINQNNRGLKFLKCNFLKDKYISQNL